MPSNANLTFPPPADFYHFNYGGANNEQTDIAPIIFDVMMYVAGEKFMVEDLKRLAARKFEKRAKKKWNTTAFADAIHVLYMTAPEDAGLRDTIIAVTQKHPELFDREAGYTRFREVLGEVAQFGRDLAMATHTKPQMARYQCPKCNNIITTSRDSSGCKLVCASCNNYGSRDFSWWAQYEIEE